MNPLRKALVAGTLAAVSLGGGALGAALVSGSASAQTPATSSTTTSSGTATSTPAATPGTPDAPGGAFHSNENATHEKTESAAREAQENAGQRPTVP